MKKPSPQIYAKLLRMVREDLNYAAMWQNTPCGALLKGPDMIERLQSLIDEQYVDGCTGEITGIERGEVNDINIHITFDHAVADRGFTDIINIRPIIIL